MDRIDGLVSGYVPSNPSQNQSNLSDFFVFFSHNRGKDYSKIFGPRIGYFFVVIIFGRMGNSSLVIRNENIFVLILSIFFDFCLHTISGGNEQVSYQDEVLFYLSVELSTHSLCLHGNKQNHLLELWRNLELMQQTPSWFISKTQ